jgi:hypothetical protein
MTKLKEDLLDQEVETDNFGFKYVPQHIKCSYNLPII